jgi:hypothetical protein
VASLSEAVLLFFYIVGMSIGCILVVGMTPIFFVFLLFLFIGFHPTLC